MAASPPIAISDEAYEAWASAEVDRWREELLKPPGPLARASRGVQRRINRAIPEPVHRAVTEVISGMTQAILTGADFVNGAPLQDLSLAERDRRALALIDDYRKVAAVEGGVAGAGGFWLSLADFPALITIKIRLLFDIARVYGKDGEDFAERLFILNMFQLAFSGGEHRPRVLLATEGWDRRDHATDFEHFDWRSFQQEYRDHIDLAKLAQLIPIVGAPIGAAVNWRLTERVGLTAINGYRMRWLGR